MATLYHRPLFSSAILCIQAVDRAVRLVEGGRAAAARPVNPKEAAKGRVEFVKARAERWALVSEACDAAHVVAAFPLACTSCPTYRS